MAKGMNVGVDDVSRKIIKTNVGVDDISRKCIRGFIGSDAPIGVDDANTKLLLHAESFTDESIYNIPVTNNGATISSAQSKFGGKSFYFDGNANIAIPHDTIIFSDEDFTIDWWEYVNATNKHQVFHQKSVANTAVGFLIGLNALYISSGSGVWDIASGVSLGDKLTKQWVHRAIVRKGDKFYIFQNGILKNTCTSNKAISASGNPTIGVYHYTTTDYYMDGYIDEFRISDIAQWTEDFIPPNQPYHVLKYGVARELFVADVTYARHYVKDTWLQLTPDTGDAYDYDYWTTSDIAIPVDGSNNWDFVNAQSTGMLWPYPEKGSADFAAWENVIDKAKKRYFFADEDMHPENNLRSMVYKATGRSAYDVYNQYITDTFRRLRITVINLTGKKIIEYEKGDYIGDVIAPYGTYPADGYNEADGYYYVLKH